MRFGWRAASSGFTCAAGPVEVEPRLFELLELASELHEATGGALDLTAGPLSEVWGFARRAGAVPDDETLALARENVGGHLVELDREARTVRFRRPGVSLNLGSIGKGYALDRAAELLARADVQATLADVLARSFDRFATTSDPGSGFTLDPIFRGYGSSGTGTTRDCVDPDLG